MSQQPDRQFHNVGPKPPGGPIYGVWVLVATHEDGTEGIYGQLIPGLGMTNFVAGHDEVKDRMEQTIKDSGIREHLRDNENTTIEWRWFNNPSE